ncbi:MAG: hypothetical protein GEV11_09650 [Streptosporangiales bacterium]|nr:hypothetical protein [Streptosporangiales bacterium]
MEPTHRGPIADKLTPSGDRLRHAADHVAGALALAPTLPEAHELLARLISGPEGGPELFPMGERTFLGTVVARAHALAAAGRPAEALMLLASAQCHEPGGHWAEVPWVLDPGCPPGSPRTT